MVEKPDARADPSQGSIALAIAVISAAIALTCGSQGSFGETRVYGGKAASPATPLGAREPEPVLRQATAHAGAAASPPDVSAQIPSERDPEALPLVHFYASLQKLEDTHQGQVRVTWLGDSHTAADFWTGSVRALLEARFGAGGPGFVRIGTGPYRHSQVRVRRDGQWRVEPNPPSRRALQDDGVFGLGGMRALAEADASAVFEANAALQGPITWQILFSLPDDASFRVGLGALTRVVNRDSAADRVADSPILRLSFAGATSDALSIRRERGTPRFYGLFAEAAGPGIVLDTAGIDGARVLTPLAWAEHPFEAELAARRSDLVVFSYGTNEVVDADRVEVYREQYRALVGRVRRALPNADCLLVGTPDVAAPGGGSAARVTEIDAVTRAAAAELGCGYFSAFSAMGGAGGSERWQRLSPPLARPDRIHLTPKGYEALAEKLVALLLDAYARFRAHAPRP